MFAPYARDAESIVTTLRRDRIEARPVGSLDELASQLDDSTGAVLLTEEALAQPNWSVLIDAVTAQPDWSSYPFILMIGQRRGTGETEAVYQMLPKQIANVMVLERPMGSATLISAVRWALSGRMRQFLTRDHLDTLKRNAQLQNLMTRELAHRVKNTIAILQSIVVQTMRPRPDVHDLSDTIVQRFGALSKAHDLLLGTGFTAADFRDLVNASLSARQGNVRTNGPSVQLSPQASLSFALVLHELATNSMKYGALKVEAGTVSIEWAVAANGSGPMFNFAWRESGGPEVAPPARQGFGTRLIRSTLNGMGEVDFDYRKTGFALTFSGELEALSHVVGPKFDQIAESAAPA